MNKRLSVWAIAALTAGLVSAQQATDRDSIPIYYNVEADTIGNFLLDEVTVTGARVIAKADRKVLLPDREQLRTATDGMDLLRKMQLPRITVNPIYGTVGRTGGARCSYASTAYRPAVPNWQPCGRRRWCA